MSQQITNKLKQLERRLDEAFGDAPEDARLDRLEAEVKSLKAKVRNLEKKGKTLDEDIQNVPKMGGYITGDTPPSYLTK